MLTRADLAAHVGRTLRLACRLRGLGVEEFARRMGVSPANSSRLLSGKHLADFNTLVRACNILQIQIQDLAPTEKKEGNCTKMGKKHALHD